MTMVKTCPLSHKRRLEGASVNSLYATFQTSTCMMLASAGRSSGGASTSNPRLSGSIAFRNLEASLSFAAAYLLISRVVLTNTLKPLPPALASYTCSLISEHFPTKEDVANPKDLFLFFLLFLRVLEAQSLVSAGGLDEDPAAFGVTGVIVTKWPEWSKKQLI